MWQRDVDCASRSLADDQLLHVAVRRVHQAALTGRRRSKDTDSIRQTVRAQVRAFEGVDCDLDRVAVALADFFADEEHRRLVPLALADDDGSLDVELVERAAHGVASGLVGTVSVAFAHPHAAGERGSFGNADEFKRKVSVHSCMAGYQPGRIPAMPTVAELLNALDTIAPPELAYPDDPIGLQVGRKSDVFEKAVVSLDVSPAAIDYAVDAGAQVIVAHHAPIYHPVRTIAGDGFQAQMLRAAIRADIAILVAHTNWDAATGGVNDTLASKLSLSDVVPFGDDVDTKAFKLSVFVPAQQAESLIDALSSAGAGGVGLYKRCAYYSHGTGTFEPQTGASPIIGTVGKREHVEEMRIEMRVPENLKNAVEDVLLKAHPYEEPAYDFWEVSSLPASLGRMGDLPEAMPFGELRDVVDSALGSRCELFGKLERKVRRVAVVGGSGGDFWLRARMAGCDVLLTGECRHHESLEASESGFAMIEAGHYHTEQPGMASLAVRLGDILSSEFIVYEPSQGRCGRSDA